MPQPLKSRTLVVHSSNALFELDLFCRALNPEYFGKAKKIDGQDSEFKGTFTTQKELLRLTRAWFELRQNILKLFEFDTRLARLAQHFPVQLIPFATGKASVLYFVPPISGRIPGALTIARNHFVAFLLNPENGRLAGPCRTCDRYYIKKTKRQNIYCSGDCGRKHTSRKWQVMHKKAERTENILQAKGCIDRWAKSQSKLEWKDYVHQETNISKNLLTRMKKEGLVVVPSERGTGVRQSRHRRARQRT